MLDGDIGADDDDDDDEGADVVEEPPCLSMIFDFPKLFFSDVKNRLIVNKLKKKV